VSASHGTVSRQAANIATTHGYTTAFQVGAFIAFAGLLISAIVIRAPKSWARTPIRCTQAI